MDGLEEDFALGWQDDLDNSDLYDDTFRRGDRSKVEDVEVQKAQEEEEKEKKEIGDVEAVGPVHHRFDRGGLLGVIDEEEEVTGEVEAEVSSKEREPVVMLLDDSIISNPENAIIRDAWDTQKNTREMPPVIYKFRCRHCKKELSSSTFTHRDDRFCGPKCLQLFSLKTTNAENIRLSQSQWVYPEEVRERRHINFITAALCREDARQRRRKSHTERMKLEKAKNQGKPCSLKSYLGQNLSSGNLKSAKSRLKEKFTSQELASSYKSYFLS